MKGAARILSFFAFVAAITAAGRAEGVPQRIAVVVGNNRGGPTKARLRYAEFDARRVARILSRLGGVTTSRLLLGSTAGRLRRTLSQLEQQVKQSGRQVVLFFYYSGHADHRALLMGGTRFTFAELRRVIKRFSI